MSALTQARAQNFLNAEFRAVAYTALAAGRRVRLMTTNGDQATAGTELVAGGSYATGGNAVTFDPAASDTVPTTYSAKVLNQALTFSNMPDTTANSVKGVEIIDGTTGAGTRAAYGALSAAKTTAAGDTLSFPAAQLTVSI